MRILSPTAILGYGFPEASFEEGLSRQPDVIAVDAGSSDPGPYYLGSGACFTDRTAVKRDLELIVAAGKRLGVPVLIGTAGGSGAAPHVARDVELLREVAAEQRLRLAVAVIHADVEHDRVRAAMARDELVPAGPALELDEATLEATTNIVAQMGAEPLRVALAAGAEVILAGRAYDPAVFAAPALAAGFAPGPAIHLGKILECGAIASTPGSGSDCLFGTLGEGWFEVEPTTETRRCTVTSVAAHTLYEKSNPLDLPGPGGHLDLSETTFTQVSERRVRVWGSSFSPSPHYAVKLEGARLVGFRTVSIAGCRDPIMIERIDEVVAMVRERVSDNFVDAGHYHLGFRLYGRDGVMGELEPLRNELPHELGIIIEAVAASQSQANTICAFARSCMLHTGYPGRMATAGNLAFPYSPSDMKGGEVYEFSIYHLMEVADPCELFPMELLSL